jgi:hypothetical protein
MAKKIRTVGDANGLIWNEIKKQEAALAKTHKPSGRDEAVIRKASERDRLKFIPRRMS